MWVLVAAWGVHQAPEGAAPPPTFSEPQKKAQLFEI